MSKELTVSTITKCMEWAYDKVVNGLPGMDSAYELAESYMKESTNPRECAQALIKWQCSKSAINGFATNFGGFMAMPVTLPANIVSVLYIQIRMVAAIAYIAGFNIKNDKVKTLAYSCLAADSAADAAKSVGIPVVQKMTKAVIESISGQTVKAINKRVGFRLLTKFGSKGLLNLTKLIPFIGGLLSALIDLSSTKTVGTVAMNTFLPEQGK